MSLEFDPDDEFVSDDRGQAPTDPWRTP
jgi:hypothetical protein